MRKSLILLLMLLSPVVPATAQISIGIGLPHLSIGINLPVYPVLEPVPGYPVYYAPQLDSNYFFYDGMYWVYQDDNWYASSWYNGPWSEVGPEYVPAFVLRIPVRYYRRPPGYFGGWQADAPPRWGDHWGNDWSRRRNGWDHWDRNARHTPPPLPAYQRQYSGDRYPNADQQRDLQRQNYKYQPRNPVVRQHYEAIGVKPAAAGNRPDRQQVPRQAPQQRQQAEQRQRQQPEQARQAPQQQQRQQAPQRQQGQDRGQDKNQNRGQGESRGNGRGEDRKD